MKHLILSFFILATLVLFSAIGVLAWSGLHDHIGIADVALVPGNTVNADGKPSARLQARLDTTLGLYKQGYFKKIIVSGGTGKEGFAEGTVMKGYLIQHGVPNDAVIVDNLGMDTYASARNTATILRTLNLKSVFVVTQYFHVPRCRLALQKLGISPIFSAHAPFFECRDVYSILRELPAYLKYSLKQPAAPAIANP
jgi:vancomycin permeability regulator SanA